MPLARSEVVNFSHEVEVLFLQLQAGIDSFKTWTTLAMPEFYGGGSKAGGQMFLCVWTCHTTQKALQVTYAK